jgi:hypothetical protein
MLLPESLNHQQQSKHAQKDNAQDVSRVDRVLSKGLS